MNVTVEVVGEGSHDLEVEDATYADLLAEVDLSPHEVSVMVDGRPVPEDQPVEADHVKVLRLIKGGSGEFKGDDEQLDAIENGPTTDSEHHPSDLGVSKLDFELPNAGAGPDPLRLSDLAAKPAAVERASPSRAAQSPGNDALVLLFQRDYRSDSCREQVEAIADRYGEFRERDAAVVSVLPESKERAEKWQKESHVPFPLVADEEKAVAEQYGQPTRFGKLGSLHDLLGRLPETAILDARGDLRLYAVHRADGPNDWPDVDTVLTMVDRLLASEPRALAEVE